MRNIDKARGARNDALFAAKRPARDRPRAIDLKAGLRPRSE